MIHIAIVEDQVSEQERLKEFLGKYQQDNHVEFHISVFSDGLEFLENYHLDEDIILMDVDMPRLNGYQTALKIREKDDSVILIFITNIASYVYKGYQVGAMDYILKPIHYPDLSIRLKACEKKLSHKEEHYLVVNSKNVLKKIPCSNIIYIEANHHDIRIHLFGEEISYRGPSLKELENELRPYGFSRCNHCYIVNLRHCQKIEGMMLVIQDKRLEISRSKKAAFLKELEEFFR